MSSPLIVASPETTVDECMALMTDRRIRHVPVVEEGKVVGVVSIGDLVKFKSKLQTFEIQYLTTTSPPAESPVARLIVLLRGVNLAGRNRVSMPELREALEEAGFEDVSTYVQSGNVVLSSKASAKQVGTDVRRLIADRFGLDISGCRAHACPASRGGRSATRSGRSRRTRSSTR